MAIFVQVSLVFSLWFASFSRHWCQGISTDISGKRQERLRDSEFCQRCTLLVKAFGGNNSESLRSGGGLVSWANEYGGMK